MLVDVVELDWHEQPRPREDVLAQVPVRGHIAMDCLWSDRDLDRPRKAVHADLRPMTLETLYSARVERWKGLHILLSGYQRQPCKGRQTGGGKFAQRWWLRIVLDPRVPPMSWNERERRRAIRRDSGGLME
jgi:hypothetical protein